MEVHTVTEGAETFTCNAYLVPGGRVEGTDAEGPTPRGPTLVDVGAYPGVVEEVRRHVDDVAAVVLTHQHGDHVAELDRVLEAFDPDLYAYGTHPERDRALADGDEVALGDETFEVVYTPGHADDHVSLVSETTLFSGDVVVHDDAAFDDGSFGRTDRPGQSRDRLIESLRDLLDRMPASVEHMYAGHGSAFAGDVHAVVERALERAERREPKYPDE